MNSSIKGWLQRGELDKLENVVLEGRGARLVGEYSPDIKTRVFLKGLPKYLVSENQNYAESLNIQQVLVRKSIKSLM